MAKKLNKNILEELIPPDQLTWAVTFSRMYPHCADCEKTMVHTLSELKRCCSSCDKFPDSKKPKFPISI